jgi:membrane protease subunit (stomatin/prohibitin family)
MKLWSSVRGQAEKVAFEADKMLRVRKEESAISDARNQIQAKHLALGQVALALYQAGELKDAQVEALATEVAAFEALIREHEERIVAIKAEQTQGAVEQAAAQAAPQAPLAPAAVSASEKAPSRFCPECGKPVEGDPAFCPECGQRLTPAPAPEQADDEA